MAKIDITVIQGTEDIVLKQLPRTFSPTVELHPNVSIITFESDKSATDFQYLKTALSVTDQRTSIKLFKRDWRVCKVAAGINPSLAYAMCELAQIKSTDSILDPFCGGGTIPISSLLYYKARIAIAADVNSFATACVRKNATAADINPDRLVVIHKDISGLELGPNSIDKIITNLPFGIRSGKHSDNQQVYVSFASQAIKWLKPGGLIIVLTQETKLIHESLSSKFHLVKDLPIFIHGLRPHISIFERFRH